MKTASHFRVALALLALSFTPAHAVLITDSATYNPNLLIPDGSTLGVVDSRNFSSQIATIAEVRVSLSIAGTPSAADAFNGDFYVTLAHSSGFAVLLNRTGRTASNEFGYADSGFNVTFGDSPGNSDIHRYQLTLDPNGSALTGIWATDGRNLDPNAVLDSTPRTARLASFNGLNPNGEWNLFAADVSSIGTGRLVTWKLEVTGEAPVIPEPGSALVGAACVLACAVSRFSHQRRVRA